MNTKKMVDFLLMRSVFSLRNIISIGLVLLFFLTYLMAGGKVETRPGVDPGQSFGGVREENNFENQIKPGSRSRSEALSSENSATTNQLEKNHGLRNELQAGILPKFDTFSRSEDRLSAIKERLKLKNRAPARDGMNGQE